MKSRFFAISAFAALVASHGPCQAAGNAEDTVSIKLSGANPMPAGTVSQAAAPSYYFAQDYQARMRLQTPPAPKAFYKDIYPGIDLTCYGDEYQLEYVFTVAPGADPSLIKLLFQGIQSISLTHTGSIRMVLPSSEIIQNAPMAFLLTKTGTFRLNSSYEMGYGGVLMINPGAAFNDAAKRLNNTKFNVIPAGGQPGGPSYDFYLSKFETDNEQFLRFLNDAEANQNTPRGSSMYFDKLGNAWINQRMKRGSDEMFEIAASRLSYDADKKAGQRYSHWRTKDGETPYTKHPVTGTTWFGALKYCNWLTIEAGRGDAARCYTEGTNIMDWAPVTATNWINGYFGLAERQAWLSVKGFRLPMLNCPAAAITTNSFDEFYKAAAWSATTNRIFAFGRDTFEGVDANYRDTTGRSTEKTFPTGFFDGRTRIGDRYTRPNDNYYGIFDLSGNVAEWVNDFATNGAPQTRVVCGGAWTEAPIPVTIGDTVPPHVSTTFGGFRTTTTFLPLEAMRIHILYSFYFDTEAAEHKPIFEEPAVGAFAPPPVVEPSVSPEEPSRAPPKPAGPTVSVVVPQRPTDSVTPDGITYKPGARGGTPPVAPPSAAEEMPGGAEAAAAVAAPEAGVEPKPPGPPPSTITNRLTVMSINPNSGAAIGVNPIDVDGRAGGNTTFTRDYIFGTFVVLSAPTNAAGNNFQMWLRNGVFYSANPLINVTMVTDMTMTAVFVPPPVVYRLTVRSSAPSQGVPISVNPSDYSGFGNGSTMFVRNYLSGSLVTVTAPLSASGNTFLKWQLDGVDLTTLRTTSVIMDSNHTLTAIYVYIPGPIIEPPISPGGV